MVCDYGWEGDSCEVKKCVRSCSNHGKCNNGTCVCDMGWTGDFCEIKNCPYECFYRGRCEFGVC